MYLEVIRETLLLMFLPFEWRIISAIGILVLLLLLINFTHRHWTLHLIRSLYSTVKRRSIRAHIFDIRDALSDLFFLAKIFLCIYLVGLLYYTFTEQPYILASTPAQYTRLQEAAPEVTLEFNVPVKTDAVTFHTSPEVEGQWEWQQSFLGLPLQRKVTFTPSESFYPGSEVVFYLVGVHTPWDVRNAHEMAVEYSAPRIPEPVEIVPVDKSVDVAIDAPIEVIYDIPLGDFADFTVQVHPDPGNIAVHYENNRQLIIFEQHLRQGQEYRVEVYRTPRSYHVETGEDIQRGDTEMITSWHFTTVRIPLIEQFEPSGQSVRADSAFRVVFDAAMEQGTVEDRFSVEPELEGVLSWEDDRTFVFTPESELEKDTEYVVTFVPGIKSVRGGLSEEEVTFSFKTLGPVRVIDTAPIAGASGVDPSTVNIRISFDQPVDHTSAEEHFSISPSVSGTFSWQENQMTFTARNLAFTTRYTFGVSEGVRSMHGLDSVASFHSSFTTKSQIFTLNVPWFKQEETFSCNLASARMALAYRGVHLSEASIKSSVGVGSDPNSSWVNGYGTHLSPIAKVIGAHRRVATRTNWNMSDLLKEVQAGNPVIVWVYNRYSQPPGPFTLDGGHTGYMGMHSEVVRGFIGSPDNPSHILTNDSWRGQLTYTVANFNSIWGYMGNTALVVY